MMTKDTCYTIVSLNPRYFFAELNVWNRVFGDIEWRSCVVRKTPQLVTVISWSVE